MKREQLREGRIKGKWIKHTGRRARDGGGKERVRKIKDGIRHVGKRERLREQKLRQGIKNPRPFVWRRGGVDTWGGK